ncbi:MAG: FAD-dependent oxidoreductase, partial [Moorella sp. (in: Bacteria)]|nr:FAD-dependent oxidoreductase [Moorella sp. (in: firmicutes)]
KKEGDFSRRSLAHYQELLERDFVLQDLRTFKCAPHFLENPRLYSLYPDLACQLAEKIFTNDGRPRRKTYQILVETVRSKTSLWQLVRDFRQGKGAI